MKEKDPNGIEAHAAGAKLDHGKLRAGLVLQGFKRALIGVSKVGTFGASKYSDDGWKSVANGFSRYQDALYRHLLVDGVDEQSGLPHLYHAAWNLLAMIELKELAPVKEAPKGTIKVADLLKSDDLSLTEAIEKQRRMPLVNTPGEPL